MNKSLLQTILAIALSAIAALIAAFIIGDFWKSSLDDAEAVKKINEGTHIIGAIDAYVVENYKIPKNLTDITENKRYTKKSSSFDWNYDETAGHAFTIMEKETQCDAVNGYLGYDGSTPSCDSIPSELSDEGFYCCTNP